MALSILDGNQSATTLSTILSSGQHITAHTVVSLGTQAITDIVNATSTGLTNTQLRASAVTVGGTVTVGNSVTIGSLPAISGTVTANVAGNLNGAIEQYDDNGNVSHKVAVQIYGTSGQAFGSDASPLPVHGTITVGNTVTIGSALPAGTNRIGVVTIGAGTVTLGAGTAQIGSVTASLQASSITGSLKSLTYQDISTVAYLNVAVGSLPALASGTNQIGSVTASISGTVPISISSVTVGNSVTIGSCVTHGVTIANTVVTFFPAQGTTVSATNFTSTTASTTLVSAVDGREVLTVFNEGAGNLHISPGATCTTVAYQVRLSAGDYWECPAGQLSLAHTAVFATAGTARVTQVS